MPRIVAFLRRSPLLVAALLVLVVVLVLGALGLDVAAQWTATLFVGGVAAWTAIDMIRDMVRGHFGLDVLALMAMIATLAVGEYVAGLIIVVMLTGGEALEAAAAGRARRELTALLDRAPTRAHVVEASGRTREVPVDEVVEGDLLVVKPAEVVPVDGTLLDDGEFDESSLTGESLPVARPSGDTVPSGAVNGSAAVRLRAGARAADSQYQRILSLVREADENRAPTVRLADRFAVPFTIVSLLIAGIAWWVSGDPVRFAQVLVLATPCPLLIAAPVAFIGGASRAASAGVIVKGGAVLEGLARARSAAFDKTGTLTSGRPEVVRIAPAGDVDADELLRLAASAEQYSTHVLAAGVVRAARERNLDLAPATGVSEVATNGVAADVDGRRVAVGKLAFVRALDPAAAAESFGPGETAVYVAVDGRAAGAIVVADPIRPEARDTIARLRHDGLTRLLVLTGDNAATGRSIAERAGIEEVHAELLPADKVELLRGVEERPVVMVGDGVNDAPVLAAADVGIAMGARGATAASESAAVVILRDDLEAVATAVEVGRRTFRIALTAILIGVVLSVVLMLVAAFGVIPAVVGALLQEVVDLVCILYALRALGGPSTRRAAAEGAPRTTSVAAPGA